MKFWQNFPVWQLAEKKMRKCSLRNTLYLVILFAVLLVILEVWILPIKDGEYTVIDSIEDQIVSLEGNLALDPNYIIVSDVPGKSPAYDENWMDGYSEGRLMMWLLIKCSWNLSTVYLFTHSQNESVWSVESVWWMSTAMFQIHYIDCLMNVANAINFE